MPSSLLKLWVDADEFARHTLNFTPDPVQAEILRSTSRRILLNCCRQWGKSTVTAALIAHRLVHGDPDTLVVAAAPALRQSAELLHKTAAFLRLCDIRPRGDGRSQTSLLLPNGARMVALPGRDATIRGFSAVSLLVFDEAARVPDETYFALRPMIAANSNAAIFAISTPHGQTGFFYDAWINGCSTWTRWQVTAPECPRIGPEFLEEERHNLTDIWFRQEYMCEFLQSQDCVFPADLVDAALFGSEDMP
ncbi:MAG: hypothetical protein IPM24_25710 [Bryobacterales bacterium]|nr:hypothetical protein [Bryobacterales bacterium]